MKQNTVNIKINTALPAAASLPLVFPCVIYFAFRGRFSYYTIYCVFFTLDIQDALFYNSAVI